MKKKVNKKRKINYEKLEKKAIIIITIIILIVLGIKIHNEGFGFISTIGYFK